MGGPEWEVQMFDEFDWAQAAVPEGTRPDLDVHEGSSVEREADQEHTDHAVINTVHLVDLVHHLHEFYEFGSHAPAVWPSAGPGLITPLGAALLGIEVILELHKAFGTGEAIQTQKGYAYGLMCAALGVRVEEPHFESWGVDTAEELRQAWWEGVNEAEEEARKPEVREAIELAIAQELATQHRDSQTDPQSRALQEAVHRTMNRIWSEGAGPKPRPMHDLAWGGPEPTWEALKEAKEKADP